MVNVSPEFIDQINTCLKYIHHDAFKCHALRHDMLYVSVSVQAPARTDETTAPPNTKGTVLFKDTYDLY